MTKEIKIERITEYIKSLKRRIEHKRDQIWSEKNGVYCDEQYLERLKDQLLELENELEECETELKEMQ